MQPTELLETLKELQNSNQVWHKIILDLIDVFIKELNHMETIHLLGMIAAMVVGTFFGFSLRNFYDDWKKGKEIKRELVSDPKDI